MTSIGMTAGYKNLEPTVFNWSKLTRAINHLPLMLHLNNFPIPHRFGLPSLHSCQLNLNQIMLRPRTDIASSCAWKAGCDGAREEAAKAEV